MKETVINSILCRCIIVVFFCTALSSQAQIVYGDDMWFDVIGGNAYVRGFYTIPEDGVLSIASEISFEDMRYPVVGNFATIPDEVKEIHLSKNFRYINCAKIGDEIIVDFEDRGIMQGSNPEFRGVLVDAANSYLKSVDGMLISADDKDLYAVPLSNLQNGGLVVPEKVEIFYPDLKVGYDSENYDYIVLPASLKKSMSTLSCFNLIISKSKEPFVFSERITLNDFELCENSIWGNTFTRGIQVIYVPSGSLSLYAETELWKDLVNYGYVEESDIQTNINLDVVFSDIIDNVDELSCKINGKECRSVVVPSLEKVNLEIEYPYADVFSIRENGRIIDFRDSGTDPRIKQNSGGHLSLAFYPLMDKKLDIRYLKEERYDNYIFESLGQNEVRIIGYDGIPDKNLIIPEIIEHNGEKNTVVEIGGFKDKQIETLSLPNSIRKIHGYAFFNNALTSINLPDELRRIDQYAFSDNKLENINLPVSLSYMHCSSFAGNDLVSVNIPPYLKDGIESVGWLYKAGGADNTIENIEIDDSPLTLVGYLAVAANNLTIRRSVESKYKYSGFCKGVKENLIFEGDSIRINPQILMNSSTLPNNIRIKADKVEINGSFSTSLAYSIGRGLQWVFSSLKHVKQIDIDCSELTMDSNSFAYLSGLQSVNFNINSALDMKPGAFYGCSSIESINLPEINGLPISSLQNCISLRSLMIPSSCRYINSLALKGCENLKEVEIAPDSEPLIVGTQTFKQLNVEELILGREVASADMPFFGIETLRKLTIRDNITSLPDYAFANCVNLKEIYCESSIAPTIGRNTFYGVSRTECKVFVRGDDGNYRASDGWKEFFSSVDSPELGRTDIKISSEGGLLHISGLNNESIAIYSMDGTELFRQKDVVGETEIELSSGLYLIAVDSHVFKYIHSEK